MRAVHAMSRVAEGLGVCAHTGDCGSPLAAFTPWDSALYHLCHLPQRGSVGYPERCSEFPLASGTEMREGRDSKFESEFRKVPLLCVGWFLQL